MQLKRRRSGAELKQERLRWLHFCSKLQMLEFTGLSSSNGFFGIKSSEGTEYVVCQLPFSGILNLPGRTVTIPAE